MNPEQLQAYFNSNPSFQEEYQRNRNASRGTDNRSPVEWMQGFLAENPGEVANFNAFINGGSPQGSDLPQDQLDALITRANAGDQQAIAQLQAAGYEQVADTEVLPVEQGILQTILPNLTSDIEGDAGRRSLINTLTGQVTDDYNSARNALSADENARRLQEEYNMADTTAGALSNSAATSAADQLAALQASIAAMQQNLTGANAEKAAALQQQIAAFTANLDSYDATQKAALAQQIAANQANLQQSITDQWVALNDEVTSLRGAVDDQSVARRAALQAEIDGLTAAQAPMAQARLDSANALATAVNLGLQGTQDALTAQRAKQGYLGSSSFSDAALARAGINARQNAAQALGAAREANAGDMRSIQARGATEGRVLADDLANSYLGLRSRQATGIRSLADILAEGTRTIGDANATGTANIANTTGAARQNIGNAGATQGYQDRVAGANDLQALLDALAKGNAGIQGTLAIQQQGARDSGTMARQGYFDNAYTRGQGALLSRPGLAANLANTLTGLDNYGSSGTNRALNTLNWFDTRGQAAPTIGTIPATVDNSGSDIAGLGAGLLGTALSVGQANNWWQAPSGAGSKTTYADFLKNNPYSSAALGQ